MGLAIDWFWGVLLCNCMLAWGSPPPTTDIVLNIFSNPYSLSRFSEDFECSSRVGGISQWLALFPLEIFRDVPNSLSLFASFIIVLVERELMPIWAFTSFVPFGSNVLVKGWCWNWFKCCCCILWFLAICWILDLDGGRGKAECKEIFGPTSFFDSFLSGNVWSRGSNIISECWL
jgi:hypothetical protein